MNEFTAIQKVNENGQNVLVLDDIPPYDHEDYNIFDEKDFAKYIADIEKIVLTSYEYRELISYLRQYMNMNKCSFLENVNNIDTFKIKIEIHHHPLTRYDIVRTIVNKRQFFNESLEVELVAQEVTYIHYFLMVGLIPLSETVHQLVHSQSLFIPLNYVMGNWRYFLEEYHQFVPDDVFEKIEVYERMTEEYNAQENLRVLEQHPTLLQLPNNPTPGSLKESQLLQLMDTMSNRINEIQTNKQNKILIKPIYFEK